VAGGTRAFTDALAREAVRVRALLAKFGGTVTTDLIRGAIILRAAVPFARVYALPDVVSISSAGTIEGERYDVLAALARAALVTRHSAVPLNGSHSWSGYLLRWEGDTVLVGHGQKGGSVRLRLSSGKGGAAVTLTADPSNGAYAFDFGRLTSTQRRLLDRSLRGAVHAPTAIKTPATRRFRIGPRRIAATVRRIMVENDTWIVVGLALIGMLVIVVVVLGRKKIVSLLR
jgi:hypothetical protein